MSFEKINVTKSFLPPKTEYDRYLNEIWSSGWLTNQGPLLGQFEEKVTDYLSVGDFHFVANGTLALQLALRALDITGEVITTPFSYVATTSAILWEYCEPVFVDIDLETFCIDPNKIEAAITDKTQAIMAVHVFGNACDIERIEAIAKKHNLKVIYDGAHAFGASYKGRSLLDYGDISTCSLHSTKLFHTIEGGAVITRDAKTSSRIELLKRFGHNGDDHFSLGINAKASEFQAAMGLCNLKYIDDIIAERKRLSELYDSQLGALARKLVLQPGSKYNYGYYPVVFGDEKQLLDAVTRLNKENIFPRRYFYPSLNTLPYLQKRTVCPNSEDLATRIVCLPLYVGLEDDIINKICEILKP